MIEPAPLLPFATPLPFTNARGGKRLPFYEFFAGGGMVRAGLGEAKWRCSFANDFDHKKSAVYRANWGGEVLKTADVRKMTTADLPGAADLAWASFPCQDLSLAGGGAGLKGDRSGTFWPFWDLMKGLIAQKRAPRVITLENVCGTLTSHGGKDFATICAALAEAGYMFGAVVIDAALFVPQSRPRLFVIAVRSDVVLPGVLLGSSASPLWHPKRLLTAYEKIAPTHRRNWVWWSMPKPRARISSLVELLEDEPRDVVWHSAAETRRLLSLMSPINRAKVETAKASGRRVVGTIYKRTRLDENSAKAQRAEARFDNVAGCLRTPAGGSSRQTIIVLEGGAVRSRLISGRETARLMGLPESYKLPDNYNEAYHLTGDGVVVPVVRHIARHLFEPILADRLGAKAAA